MDVISKGLTISGMGVLVTFLALAVFIIVMVALQKLFPHKQETDEAAKVSSAVASNQVSKGASDIKAEEVAAISAAVTHLRALSQSSLGTTLSGGRGAWWVKNRLAANRSGTTRK